MDVVVGRARFVGVATEVTCSEADTHASNLDGKARRP